MQISSINSDNHKENLIYQGEIELSYYKIKIVYAILILISSVLNMSSGSYSSLLKIIQTEFSKVDEEMGLVSSMHFWGQILGCLSAFIVIEYNIRKLLLLVSITICFGSLLSIGLTNNFNALLVLRLLNGYGASFISVNNPVWIDQFIKSSHSSIFMAIHMLSSIIGTIAGVLLAIPFLKLGWNSVFLIESFFTAGLLVGLAFIKPIYFDRKLKRINDTNYFITIHSQHEMPEDSSDTAITNASRHDLKFLLRNIKLLFKNKVSLCYLLLIDLSIVMHYCHFLSFCRNYSNELDSSIRQRHISTLRRKHFFAIRVCMYYFTSAWNSDWRFYITKNWWLSKDKCCADVFSQLIFMLYSFCMHRICH